MDVSACKINLTRLKPEWLAVVLNDLPYDGMNQKSLALLGDSLLGLFIRELALKGFLPKILAQQIITNHFLALIVKDSRLSDLLPKDRKYDDAALGTVFEALIGAMYREHGFEKTKEYFLKEVYPWLKLSKTIFHKLCEDLKETINTVTNPEIALVMKCQELGLPRPVFSQPHKHKNKSSQIFIRVVIEGFLDLKTFGRNKKEAMQCVSWIALTCLNARYPVKL